MTTERHTTRYQICSTVALAVCCISVIVWQRIATAREDEFNSQAFISYVSSSSIREPTLHQPTIERDLVVTDSFPRGGLVGEWTNVPVAWLGSSVLVVLNKQQGDELTKVYGFTNYNVRCYSGKIKTNE